MIVMYILLTLLAIGLVFSGFFVKTEEADLIDRFTGFLTTLSGLLALAIVVRNLFI